MKIVNWNVGRPSKSKAVAITEKLLELDADIVVLTETTAEVSLPEYYNLIATMPLPSLYDSQTYKIGENRASIWTKYTIEYTHDTFDGFTSVCADVKTPKGLLRIYATIIGVFGGKGQRFKDDLQAQLADFDRLFSGKQVCLAGDYNTIFTGYPYPSHDARSIINEALQKFSLTNTTAEVVDSVNHICISTDYLKNKHTQIQTWDMQKKLSDHFGTAITIRG